MDNNEHRFSVSIKPLLIFFGLLVFSIAILINSLGKDSLKEIRVEVKLDDKLHVFETGSLTVSELLNENNIVLGDKTYINLSLEDRLDENTKILIKNPHKYVVKTSKFEHNIESFKDKVEDVLEENNYLLAENDYTAPALSSNLLPGDTINIYHSYTTEEIEEESIPYNTIVNKDPNLTVGTSKIAQAGSDGVKELEFSKTYVNGSLVSKTLVRDEVKKPAVNQIALKGSKPIVLASRGDIDRTHNEANGGGVLSDGNSYSKVLTMHATAYDPTPASNGKWGNKTALGTIARRGVVAVDPKVIPLRTKLYIEIDGVGTYGHAVAEDTGSAIKGNRIDICYETPAEVRAFGRRTVKVYVLD